MDVLISKGLDICLCHMGNIFTNLKQMTIGRRCVTEASNPLLYDSCKDCHDAILLELHFKSQGMLLLTSCTAYKLCIEKVHALWACLFLKLTGEVVHCRW